MKQTFLTHAAEPGLTSRGQFPTKQLNACAISGGSKVLGIDEIFLIKALRV